MWFKAKIDIIFSHVQAQLARTKEQVDRLSEEKLSVATSEQRQQEVVKRIQRQLRDQQEQYAELERKEAEASQRRQDLVCISSPISEPRSFRSFSEVFIMRSHD